jgi:hypothetical protein
MELIAEGPELGIMDCEHHELLKSSKCNEEILEASWFEWRRLGCYKHGEKQCRRLALQAQEWGLQDKLVKKLRQGFGYKRAQFELQLLSQGQKETRKGGKWEGFVEYEPLDKFFGLWPRLDRYLDVNGVEVNPDDYLGEEIYDVEDIV